LLFICSAVFGADDTRVLNCQWHVLRAVSDQLVQKVTGATAKADRSAIYKDFTAVLRVNLGASDGCSRDGCCSQAGVPGKAGRL
jgi:hypothetical protein